MERQVYAYDPAVNAYRHMYVDLGRGEAKKHGTSLAPTLNSPATVGGNCGRKVTHGSAA